MILSCWDIQVQDLIFQSIDFNQFLDQVPVSEEARRRFDIVTPPKVFCLFRGDA